MATGVYCASCGYDLAGLPAGKCPECERGFDPGDPGTFDARPRRTRRRKWITRGAVLLAVIGLMVALAPRGYVTGTLVIDDGAGTVHEFERTQLVPPRWVAAATPYPWWTTRREGVGQRGPVWTFKLTAQGTMYGLNGAEGLGTLSAQGQSNTLFDHTINGIVVAPKNAGALFRSILPDMAAGRPHGVTLGTAP